jgi:hypothetical protein
MSGPFEMVTNLRAVPMTLYTDQLIVRGTIQTTQHRVTDILNQAPEPYLVLEDVSLEDYGPAGTPTRAAFAQVNLASVLFAVSLTTVEPIRELRTPKVSERALLSIPPFRVVGYVHLLPARGLRAGLADLHGAFIPVTDATFWADRLGESYQTVAFLAINHARAQVFAPFPDPDPWVGASRGPAAPPTDPTPAG